MAGPVMGLQLARVGNSAAAAAAAGAARFDFAGALQVDVPLDKVGEVAARNGLLEITPAAALATDVRVSLKTALAQQVRASVQQQKGIEVQRVFISKGLAGKLEAFNWVYDRDPGSGEPEERKQYPSIDGGVFSYIRKGPDRKAPVMVFLYHTAKSADVILVDETEKAALDLRLSDRLADSGLELLRLLTEICTTRNANVTRKARRADTEAEDERVWLEKRLAALKAEAKSLEMKIAVMYDAKVLKGLAQALASILAKIATFESRLDVLLLKLN